MRVYVSSTSEDLHDFRAAVVQLLGRLGHLVVSMGNYLLRYTDNRAGAANRVRRIS